ncbi:potassium-transporting ATPase subunit KdpA [Polyangium aurulentum]|uniref:potassium-transporting ATPase subunit KdpA n=1 Tax=Polyangium aurulentum TaxID=2567896 RepID=UPI0010AEA594|nr:potassium-transporting ATPase subunit KdpA [Polyangium aurulentum]UQA55588.1 potassium-transporting ATPase subunit KdpA [Polyangium aurulentum]
MTPNGFLQIALFMGVLLGLSWPLGAYMARVYQGERTLLGRILGPLERLLYRAAGVKADEEMDWKRYALAMLLFNAAGALLTYAILRLQHVLPANPQGMAPLSPDLAFNTAASFVTNTNWQAYGGETTLSYLAQMAALSVQNFVSAATGMAVLVALVRGLSQKTAETLGNFWVDLARSALYILLPLSILVALVLVAEGVVQTLSPHGAAPLLEATRDAHGNAVVAQVLPLGPAASQIAIKLLGTNGGGFFNANSAHPFENPTPLSNFVEMLALVLIPAGLCHTFGRMVGDKRQGLAVLAAMTAVLVPLLLACTAAEQSGNPVLAGLGVDLAPSALAAGGNMEGKEVRFGITASTTFATLTTATSCGAVNSMHDSYTPLGGLVPMWLMQLGEVVFGGVGSGLYGMLVFAIIAVFVAGLMVGRTPEYVGKKIEAFEIKMASLVILVPPILVLCGTALSVSVDAGRAGILNAGPHGFSEILYAFSSAGNNNGSAFGGLTVNTIFYDTVLGVTMLFARYWTAIPVLALAGSLAKKKLVPAGPGTLPTHTPLFVALLVGVVILVGALTFVPALALGPVVEHLQMSQAKGTTP